MIYTYKGITAGTSVSSIDIPDELCAKHEANEKFIRAKYDELWSEYGQAPQIAT